MSEKRSVLVVTTPTVPGYEIVKVLGAVSGITVRARGVGGKIAAGIEGIFAGEVTSGILRGMATTFAAYGTAVIIKPTEQKG